MERSRIESLFMRRRRDLRTPKDRAEEHLRLKYGMSPKDYEILFEVQNGKCSICLSILDRSNPFKVCIDHDHLNGKVRSLVCKRCNQVLGMVDDDIVLLKKYIAYLEVFKKLHDGGPLEN